MSLFDEDGGGNEEVVLNSDDLVDNSEETDKRIRDSETSDSDRFEDLLETNRKILKILKDIDQKLDDFNEDGPDSGEAGSGDGRRADLGVGV